jgi:DNA-directed RNA polymerase specialized sigma24 family protein
MAAATAKKNNKPTAPVPLHRVLREVLRHYTEYRALVNQDGRLHVIDYGYWVYNEDGTRKKKVQVCISFWDLYYGLKELAPRKREAIFYNVILDQKQKDVAKHMGITTVSVGQYVEAGCLQLAKMYFTDEERANAGEPGNG